MSSKIMSNTSSKGGVGAVGVVQIVFIILKCTKTGVIRSWPWWKVMLPFICTIGLVCFCGSIACCGVIAIEGCCNDKTEKSKHATVEIDIENPHEKQQVVVSTCNDSSTYRIVN